MALVEALDSDLDWKRSHTRLLVRAREWEAKGLDKSFLLRGKDLRDAEEWQSQAGKKEPKPTALQSEYILAGRRAETRRQRLTSGALATGLLLTLVLFIVALIQRNAARREAAIAVSRQFAAESQQALNTDLGVALQRAVQSGHQWQTEEAQVTLEMVLQGRLVIHNDGPVCVPQNLPYGFWAIPC